MSSQLLHWQIQVSNLIGRVRESTHDANPFPGVTLLEDELLRDGPFLATARAGKPIVDVEVIVEWQPLERALLTEPPDLRAILCTAKRRCREGM